MRTRTAINKAILADRFAVAQARVTLSNRNLEMPAEIVPGALAAVAGPGSVTRADLTWDNAWPKPRPGVVWPALSEPETIRPLVLDDAEELAALYRANSDFLVPFVEIRDDGFFTSEGQRARIERAFTTATAREGWRFAILDGAAIAGTIGLTNVVRGPLQCAKLGYWIDRARNGRGLATAAVGVTAAFAFAEAGLHRLEAWTLVENHASQRVLEKNGFNRFGLARNLLTDRRRMA